MRVESGTGLLDADSDAQQLVVFLATDERTAQAVGRPQGRLRAI
ncbi:hypothetical protein AB0D57_33760 [Streptomyces sp. NPDC048275]